MPSALLARVVRGETVESVHAGHVCIIDGERSTIARLGDPATVTYFRSACKALQFMPCITSGAADAFGFNEEEIALAVASHSGEPQHVRIASQMLAKAGLTPEYLQCGAHSPFNEDESKRLLRLGQEPTPLHNNCSGKHAAMLAFAKHIGAPLDDYLSLDHIVQKQILHCVAEFTGIGESEIAIGIDGCAAPNFAVPLAAMARSVINLFEPGSFSEATQSACKRIVAAMLAHPELIGGVTRLDTMIMRAAKGKVISKVGADGVWLCGILPSDKFPSGAAIALKIADGDDHRARPVVAVEILRQLGVLAVDDLSEVSPMPIKNRRGEFVGRIESALEQIRGGR